MRVVLHPRAGGLWNAVRDDVPGWNRIIDDEHRQIVTPRSVNPHELPVFQQTLQGIRRMQPHQRSTLRITGARRDVACDHQPWLGRFDDQASSLIGSDGTVALPTATYPLS